MPIISLYGRPHAQDHGAPPARLEGCAQTHTRCPRCAIPLGGTPCPNPLCPEVHGQRAGACCAWCATTMAQARAGWDDGQHVAAHGA